MPCDGFRARRGDINVDLVLLSINGDLVTISHKSDWTANLSFRSDVTYDESVRTTAESTVRQESHITAEPGAHDGGCWSEHLRHPGSTLRTFVPNNDHITFLNLTFFQAFQHEFFRIEAAGCSGEDKAFLAGNLGHSAFRRQVATHDSNVASRFDWLLNR